jgi:alkylation response protein AidB-like acyl-CoA dehydrogenase
MLHDLVQRVAAERHTPEKRRAAIARSCGFDRALWQELGQLGLLGAALPESQGGLGAGAVAMMLIMSGLGRNLVNSPYVPTVVCAGALLAREGDEEQRARHLPALLAGESVVAFACAEAADNGYLDAIRATARRSGDGYSISGGKSLVIGYQWSDQLVVVCKLAEAEDQLGAFLLRSGSAGISARHGRTIDGGSASELTFEQAFAPAAARIGSRDLRPALEQIRDEAVVALCADATGSMSALLEATTEYARTRKQFGKHIGSFQALQHRMVDMLLACEQAISITHQAALKLEGDPVGRQLAVSAAKALVGRNSRMVAQAAIQIHGGIGITDELAVSHHFRRVEIFNLQSGVVDWHTRRYAALLDAGCAQESPAA